MARYKQKCSLCKKEWAIVISQRQRVICNTCAESLLRQPIEDPALKKLFTIDPKFYEQSPFLRDLRLFYSLYKRFSDKQSAAFKKVLDNLQNPQLLSDKKTAIKKEKKEEKKKE